MPPVIFVTAHDQYAIRAFERFAVRSGERTILVPVEEVDWIEAFQKYVRLHAGPATHLLHVPMSTIRFERPDSNRRRSPFVSGPVNSHERTLSTREEES